MVGNLGGVAFVEAKERVNAYNNTVLWKLETSKYRIYCTICTTGYSVAFIPPARQLGPVSVSRRIEYCALLIII